MKKGILKKAAVQKAAVPQKKRKIQVLKEDRTEGGKKYYFKVRSFKKAGEKSVFSEFTKQAGVKIK